MTNGVTAESGDAAAGDSLPDDPAARSVRKAYEEGMVQPCKRLPDELEAQAAG